MSTNVLTYTSEIVTSLSSAAKTAANPNTLDKADKIAIEVGVPCAVAALLAMMKCCSSSSRIWLVIDYLR